MTNFNTNENDNNNLENKDILLNDEDALIDNLSKSLEYLSRTSPTTMPAWMD